MKPQEKSELAGIDRPVTTAKRKPARKAVPVKSTRKVAPKKKTTAKTKKAKRPKSVTSKSKNSHEPKPLKSLAGLVRNLRKEPVPRPRIVDIMAYAAVKYTHPARLADQSNERKNARRAYLFREYRKAEDASKGLALLPRQSLDIPLEEKQRNEDRRHEVMEALLQAKIAFTLDTLDIPASGHLETDIHNIGMQCIGNVDYQYTGGSRTPSYPSKSNAQGDAAEKNFVNKKEQCVAIAHFFNMVLYDVKTEEILKGQRPELETGDTIVKLAETYHSLFDRTGTGKKLKYHLKPDVFANEADAKRYAACFKMLEDQLSLMSRSPERIRKAVGLGRALLKKANAPKERKPGFVSTFMNPVFKRKKKFAEIKDIDRDY